MSETSCLPSQCASDADKKASVRLLAENLRNEVQSHRSTRDDLMLLRRDLASLRESSMLHKIAQERKCESLRSKLSEMSTQALLAKGCVADVRVIGGAFEASSSSEDLNTPGQLAMDQVRDLERERNIHLDQMIALKQLAVECINALREAGRKLALHAAYERAEMSNSTSKHQDDASGELKLTSATTSKSAFIGELFPPLFFLSNNKDGSSSSDQHPALVALGSALQEVRNQSETLDTLRSDRSASLQRLLSKAKLKISEEAWTEANAERSSLSNSGNGYSAASSTDSTATELQSRLNALQEAYDRQTKMMEQSEEAAAAARGLLDMYREKDERTGLLGISTALPKEVDEKAKSKGRTSGSEMRERREMAEKMQELELEKQKYVAQRQELAAAKKAFEKEKEIFLKHQPSHRALEENIQDASSSSIGSTSRFSNRRSAPRPSRVLLRTEAADAQPSSDSKNYSVEATTALRRVSRESTGLPSAPAEDEKAGGIEAKKEEEPEEQDATIIDHGVQVGLPSFTQPPATARIPSAGSRAAPSQAGSKASTKRRASAAGIDAAEEARAGEDALAESLRRSKARTDAQRPPLASRRTELNSGGQRRRRSSARIASHTYEKPAEPEKVRTVTAVPGTGRKVTGAGARFATSRSGSRA